MNMNQRVDKHGDLAISLLWHVSAMSTFNQPFSFASLTLSADGWQHLTCWALTISWHCLPSGWEEAGWSLHSCLGRSFWEPPKFMAEFNAPWAFSFKRMLKEVRGRYSSKSGQEGGRLDAILPSEKKKNKKQKKNTQRTIMGEKKKSDSESSIFSQCCFLKISISILNSVLNFYSPPFCSLSQTHSFWVSNCLNTVNILYRDHTVSC